eukprot:765196-Hanusia_phi.AAC.1
MHSWPNASQSSSPLPSMASSAQPTSSLPPDLRPSSPAPPTPSPPQSGFPRLHDLRSAANPPQKGKVSLRSAYQVRELSDCSAPGARPLIPALLEPREMS